MSGEGGGLLKSGRLGWMEVVELVGIIACLNGFMVMFTTFMWLYLAGAACPFESYLSINDYNEADFEFILLLLLFPTAVFASIRGVKRMVMEKRGAIKTKK